MNQDGFAKPALIAGVLIGVLSALPVVGALNCLCCAWVIAGGVLAAYLHVQASPITVTLGRGVVLGLLAGAIGAVVDTLFSIPLHFALAGVGMGIAEQMNEALEQVPNMPADVRDALRSIFAGGGQAGVVFVILAGFFKLAIYSLVGMLGGAIGAAIFEKRPPGADSRTGPPVYQPPREVPPPVPPDAPNA
jgi:hypothetical protein